MLNHSNPAPLEDEEIFSPPICHLTDTPWSPQHEWPAQSFPGISGTPGFPEYPVTFSEDIVQAQADPQAPRHTVAVGAQAGHISGFTIGPQLQVEDGLGTSVVFMPGNAQPYSIAQPAALHRQPFDDTQPRDTEDYGAIFNFTANGTSAPTTSHGQGSYVLNNGAIAGVAPISPYAPQLPAYQNHCRDTAQNKIPAEQLAIDPRLIYDPPQDNISPTIAQRRAATSTRAERRAEPYPTSRVATTRAAHADAMSPTAAMLQRFAAAAQHGGHHAFDTNSSLQFNSVQDQMITSFPRSASTSGNTARRRYSSASSGYLSSGSSQSPTTPTPDMPFGMPYGPVSVGSPTSPILAAYNDWSMQIMPSLAAPQHQVFMPTFYAMDEPSTSYARHGHMATLVNTYGALATPTSPDPYLVARLPAVEETRRRGIEELEDDGQSATSQRSSKQTKHKKKVEEFRVESSEQQPRTGKALKEQKSRSKTSDRRQEAKCLVIKRRICVTDRVVFEGGATATRL
ncbi:hypothetical protein FA95DRAFT_1680909 [Auriscalpium vulgare]|uniref:Uncharacterized protein n=1 Tax=Auriscalpium vulgare TaxID=40419 RepID=A0ACB8RKN6_9AGAM|nr:hypothetical protein FA95DRAFT_1680909 [Auriscalpium vulgare]